MLYIYACMRLFLLSSVRMNAIFIAYMLELTSDILQPLVLFHAVGSPNLSRHPHLSR